LLFEDVSSRHHVKKQMFTLKRLNSFYDFVSVKDFQKLREGTSRVLINFLMLLLTLVEESALEDNLNGGQPP
jgi:hypothetical protein